jgi:anti-sigma regulatory factor (Ser/Thr protein kinase)
MSIDHLSHPGFVHEAVFHDGPAALAASVAPDVLDGMARGDAVLVCLREQDWAHLAGALGARAADVSVLAPDVRYGRPGVAMATLHRFVDDAVATGASSAWSIGTIPFDGTARDRRWFRYEHAVQDVLGHLPLRAVCTYDTASMPPEVLAAARDAHHDDVGPLPPVALAPAAPPAVDMAPHDATSVRNAVGAVFAGSWSVERLDDLRLITSELVTNALRHGRRPVTVRAWDVDGDALLQVTDHGVGWTDRYPDLRSNRGTAAGGYGWWLIGQLADGVEVVVGEGGTVVTVTVRS